MQTHAQSTELMYMHKIAFSHTVTVYTQYRPHITFDLLDKTYEKHILTSWLMELKRDHNSITSKYLCLLGSVKSSSIYLVDIMPTTANCMSKFTILAAASLSTPTCQILSDHMS